MSLVVASLADSRHAQSLIFASSVAAGVGLILTGLAPSLPVAIVTMIVASGGSSLFQTLNNSVTMRRAEPEFYGRLASLMMIAWGLTNLISLPIGVLGDAIGERAALSSLGVALSVVTMLSALWARRIDATAAPDLPLVRLF